ncbi:MAG: hypothetical protein J5706_02400 [Elusimicrobiales bacterium]|nr:hypothetical protein [Elusimicrobiales bacterium]
MEANKQPTGIQNYSPALGTTPEGIDIMRKRNLMKELKVCIPAVVISFDRSKGRAEVQPAITLTTTAGEQVERSAISVPVHNPGGGGFLLSFPLKKGDTGWLMTADQDITFFLQTGRVSAPGVFRRHDLADSFFIPDSVITGNNKPSFSGNDSAAAVLQSTDGSVKISMAAGKITIKAAAIEIQGDTSATGSITAGGDIESSGDITGAEIKAGTIALTTHIHGGVTPGSGTTGTPQGA